MAVVLDSAAAAQRAPRATGSARTLTLALAPICVALLLRALALEPFAITSESMLPTLRPGDRVFVNKLAYGARLPFSGLRLPALREPARGDLVVFEAPGAERARIVKRIVGLPGERIELRGGELRVNGVAPEQWATGTLRVDGARHPLAGARERLGACEHAVLHDIETREGEHAWLVPPDHYFVLGDNREHSADSRVFGPVARGSLLGPVAKLPWSGPRFERTGDGEG